MRVDELASVRRCPNENAKPAERVMPHVLGTRIDRNARPANAMKAITAGDELAFQCLAPLVGLDVDARVLRVDIARRHVSRVEYDASTGVEPRLHQILDHFVLRVDGDRAPGQL